MDWHSCTDNIAVPNLHGRCIVNIDLSEKNGYAIAAAIRGPDSDLHIADTLKWIFTARIRHMTCAAEIGLVRDRASNIVRYSNIDCCSDSVCSGIRDLKHCGLEQEFDVIHFLSHIIEALTALRDMGIGDQKENALLLDLAYSIWLYADRYNNARGVEIELQRDIDTTLNEIAKLDQAF